MSSILSTKRPRRVFDFYAEVKRNEKEASERI